MRMRKLTVARFCRCVTGEPLTPKLIKTATSRITLYDWAEEKHRRRIKHRNADGTVTIETKDYAFTENAQKKHESSKKGR